MHPIPNISFVGRSHANNKRWRLRKVVGCIFFMSLLKYLRSIKKKVVLPVCVLSMAALHLESYLPSFPSGNSFQSAGQPSSLLFYEFTRLHINFRVLSLNRAYIHRRCNGVYVYEIQTEQIYPTLLQFFRQDAISPYRKCLLV